MGGGEGDLTRNPSLGETRGEETLAAHFVDDELPPWSRLLAPWGSNTLPTPRSRKRGQEGAGQATRARAGGPRSPSRRVRVGRRSARRLLFPCQPTLGLGLGIGLQGNEVCRAALLRDEGQRGCHLVRKDCEGDKISAVLPY